MTKHKTLVQDIMTPDPVTVSPDATLAEAYDLMAENEVRRLPVVTAERIDTELSEPSEESDEDHPPLITHELVGMVTLSDILGSIPTMLAETDVETRLLLSARKVRDVMSWRPVTITPDDTIQEAAERMLEYQVSGLPVIEGGGRVVGIITESDIFRLVVESWSEE